MFNPNASQEHERGPRRCSDKAVEKASDKHVERMRLRRRAGQPHAPTVTVTVWRPMKDGNGGKRFYPSTEKRVQLAGFPDVTKKGTFKEQIAAAQACDQNLAQAKMMSENKPTVSAGGCNIDPLAF